MFVRGTPFTLRFNWILTHKTWHSPLYLSWPAWLSQFLADLAPAKLDPFTLHTLPLARCNASKGVGKMHFGFLNISNALQPCTSKSEPTLNGGQGMMRFKTMLTLGAQDPFPKGLPTVTIQRVFNRPS